MFGYCFYEAIIKKPRYQFKYLFLIFLSYGLILIIPSRLSAAYPTILFLTKTLYLIGASGILASLFIIGFSFQLSQKFNNEIFIRVLTYFGVYSILVYVFHMPTFLIFNKISNILNLDPNYTKLMMLFLPGVFFPLIYGKVLSRNKLIYRILLGVVHKKFNKAHLENLWGSWATVYPVEPNFSKIYFRWINKLLRCESYI